MGMFSWECVACGFSLRECRGCAEGSWMAEGVVLTPDGSRVFGHYDGYGGLGHYNLAEQIGKFAVYHRACWELAGKPDYTKPSPSARDQGFCLPLHGQPLPKPTTREWLDTAAVWRVLGRVLDAYERLKIDLEIEMTERLFESFDAEGKTRLCAAFTTATAELAARKEARQEAWFNDPDPDAPEPAKISDPEIFEFEGRVFDWGWLSVSVSRMERAS